MDQIEIPYKLNNFVTAITQKCPASAKAMIEEAFESIYKSNESDLSFLSFKISKEDRDAIFSLAQGLNPQNMIEAALIVQIAVSHILGLRRLSMSFQRDQVLGLKLLQFSKATMGLLTKTRQDYPLEIKVKHTI